VGVDVISCFKEIGINWKEKIKGVCEKAAAINVNEMINLIPNLQEEIMQI
jgi:hypothetical protein